MILVIQRVMLHFPEVQGSVFSDPGTQQVSSKTETCSTQCPVSVKQ